MPSLIQSIKGAFNNATSGTINIGASFSNGTVDTTPGNFLVAFVGSHQSGRLCSASDNVNGAYSTDANASSCSICTFPNIAGGAITVTYSISGGNTGCGALVEEWSGITAVTPLDQHTTANATATTTITVGPTGTLSQSAELVLAICATRNGAGASYAVQSPLSPDAVSPVGYSLGSIVAAGSQVVSSTAAVSATFNWTNTVNSAAAIATYKIAAPVNPLLMARKYFIYNT
jgi:hypothetical protein